MFNSNSTATRKISGTIVLTITYGFVGYWGEGFVNSTASSTLQFDFEGQNVVETVNQLRQLLIGNLDISLRSEENRRRFGQYAQKIFDLYHVISEAQMFIP
jgi:hypothetical protein